MGALLGAVTGTSVQGNHFERWLCSTTDIHRRPDIHLTRGECAVWWNVHSRSLFVTWDFHSSSSICLSLAYRFSASSQEISLGCIHSSVVSAVLSWERNICFHYHSSIKPPFDRETASSERDLSHGKWYRADESL